MVATMADRSLALRRRGKSGADRITLAGDPTARLFGGMVPDTSESAPMTVPSPIVVPGITDTRHGSHTLLPSVTGSYDTGDPSNALSHTPCVKIRQWPPIPVSYEPGTLGNNVWRPWRGARESRESTHLT